MTNAAKRQIIVTAIYAIAGALAISLMAVRVRIPSLPMYLFFRVVDAIVNLSVDGLTGLLFALLVNGMIYGVVGYAVARMAGTTKRIIIASVVIVLLLTVITFGWDVLGPRWGRHAHIEQLRHQSLAALERNPNSIFDLHWLGVHHFSRTHDLTEAERYFSRAVKLPANEESSRYQNNAYLYLALIYQAHGKHPEAEAMHQAFLDTIPDTEGEQREAHYPYSYDHLSQRYLRNRPPDD